MLIDALTLAVDPHGVQRMWFLIPLVVVISLVYSASRHEAPPVILSRALRLFLLILFGLGIILAILAVLNWWE